MTSGGHSMAEGLNLQYQGLVRSSGKKIRTLLAHRGDPHWPAAVRVELSALATILEGWAPREARALTDVALERRRHVDEEGWTPEHDDEHMFGTLARAGGCYALGATLSDPGRASPASSRMLHDWWPWHPRWWKPQGGARRMLVKAASLIVAEIERIDRADDRALSAQTIEHSPRRRGGDSGQ